MNDNWISSVDIGKMNRFKFKQGFDFSFVLKDETQTRDILLIRVKFKQKKVDQILNNYASVNKDGELLFPVDLPADKLFELSLFGDDGEKDATPERPKFSEQKFSGFSN